MTFEALTRVRLQAGETLHLPVEARSVVRVARGAVRLREAPVWLGERMVERSGALQEGQGQRFAQPGWIEIAAQGDAEILCYRQPGLTIELLRVCAVHARALLCDLRRTALRH